MLEHEDRTSRVGGRRAQYGLDDVMIWVSRRTKDQVAAFGQETSAEQGEVATCHISFYFDCAHSLRGRAELVTIYISRLKHRTICLIESRGSSSSNISFHAHSGVKFMHHFPCLFQQHFSGRIARTTIMPGYLV